MVVLGTAAKPGECFELPGGKLTSDNGDEINLEPIKGKLRNWLPLTEALHETLNELQHSGGTHNPRPLFDLLIKSRPQFSGGDQHDSHELLRYLLDSVRYINQIIYYTHTHYKNNQSPNCDVSVSPLSIYLEPKI